MIWKIKPKPKYGSKRIITRFLLFPLQIGNEVRWLNKYSYQEEYIKNGRFCFVKGTSYWYTLDGWIKTKWINSDEKT